VVTIADKLGFIDDEIEEKFEDTRTILEYGFGLRKPRDDD
jgi:hypothetical protein